MVFENIRSLTIDDLYEYLKLPIHVVPRASLSRVRYRSYSMRTTTDCVGTVNHRASRVPIAVISNNVNMRFKHHPLLTKKHRMCRACASRAATWLILPVVICLSLRLSHACRSIGGTDTSELRMAHYISYCLLDDDCFTRIPVVTLGLIRAMIPTNWKGRVY